MPKKVIKPTLIIDSREKVPFDFDGDDDFADVIVRKLDAGDYSLEGLEHLVLIERKATCNELYQNFCSKAGVTRLNAEADRLSEVPYRFMVIEQSLEDVANPEQYYVNRHNRNSQKRFIAPAVVKRNLVHWMLDYDIHVIFAGAKAQSITKKLLLEVYERYRKGKIDDSGNPTS